MFRNEKTSSWGGLAPNFDIVITTIPDGSYAASIVDVNNGELYLTGDTDAQPGMAAYKLFDLTCDKLANTLRTMEPRQSTGATQAIHAEKA